MYRNSKELVNELNDSEALGYRFRLWKEEDGSRYVSFGENYYGPLTDEEIAAYLVLRRVQTEPDDWVTEPLIDPLSLPRIARLKDRKDVAVMGRRHRIFAGDEVLVTGYTIPQKRNEAHVVTFKLIDVPGSGEYEGGAELFDCSGAV